MRTDSRHADLLIAGWLGLVAGLGEAIVFTVIQLIPGAMTWNLREMNVSLDFLWIAPAVNVVLFLVLAVVVRALTRLADLLMRTHATGWPRVAIVLLTALACYVVLRTPDRLFQFAAILLSLGVAVRLWTLVREQLPVTVTRIRRSLPWLVGGIALLGTGLQAGERIAEMRGRNALPVLPPQTPNVLLVVIDTLRADHLSGYGYDRKTSPNLDRIASEGTLFEWAIAPSSWTLASHASMFTGREVHEHLADSEHPFLDTRYTTLAEQLGSSGFLTAGFSANVNWATRQAGLARGFLHFEDVFGPASDAVARTVLGKEIMAPLVRHLGDRIPLGRKRASDVTNSFTSWLDGVGDTPFFAFVNYFDTHSPYVAPLPYRTQFMTDRQRAIEGGFSFMPPLSAGGAADGADLLSAGYDGAVAYVDAEIDRLLAALQARGQLNRTVVVITSDHGEAFADHGQFSHGHSLYADQIHVPLIVRFPGRVPGGTRVSAPVGLVDIPTTVLDLAGQEAAAMPGHSLSRFWDRASARPDSAPVLSEVGHRDGVPASWPISTGPVSSLILDDWHFIKQRGGEVLLFRFRDDARELKNLADDPAQRSRVETFDQVLQERLRTARNRQ
jgi:arylsulfatase A-like enzyme